MVELVIIVPVAILVVFVLKDLFKSNGADPSTKKQLPRQPSTTDRAVQRADVRSSRVVENKPAVVPVDKPTPPSTVKTASRQDLNPAPQSETVATSRAEDLPAAQPKPQSVKQSEATKSVPPKNNTPGKSLSIIRYDSKKEDSGRVLFANAVKAFLSQNGRAFPYWLDQVMARPVEDAYSHVAAQYRLVWSRNVIVHHTLFREFEVPVQVDSLIELEGCLIAIERLLSYDLTANVCFVVVGSGFVMPVDLLSDWAVSNVMNQFRKGSLLGCGDDYIEQERYAIASSLRNGRDNTLLNWTVSRLACDPGWTGVVDLMLGELAGRLALLSTWEKDRALSKRLVEVACLCAAKANPTALDYGNMVSHFRALEISIPPSVYQPPSNDCWTVTAAGELLKAGESADSDADVPEHEESPLPDESLTERLLLKRIEKSLHGLVGLDGLKTLLAMDICEFLAAQQSRGRVFWGASGVGKTEIAQRLSGLREGFPSLDIGSGEVRYVSGVDGKLEIKQIVDSLPPLSIVFVDEADKCLDPQAGMVNPAEATQIRHSIITHFQRKPILWVFLGVFSHMRVDGVLTDESLRLTFGDELASRLDYADWGFPSWTLETLLMAVNSATSRRKFQYDDDAALIIAQYCLRGGGGVRAFDNIETAIARHLRVAGKANETRVSLGIVRELLAKRGISAVE